MNITLIGLKGTGKTTISKLLAKRLDKKLISTDEEILKKIRLSAEKFARKYGIERLREAESITIEGLSDFDECVFDTNSSIVLRNENIINLKKNGLIVLLTSDPKTIAQRLKSQAYKSDNLENLQERYRRSADYLIDTSNLSPEDVCDLITHYIQMELQ